MYLWVKLDISALPLHRLSGGALSAFLALGSIMQEDGTATCSYDRLRASIGVSRRTIIRAIGELEREQLIHKENVSGSCLRVRLIAGIAVGRNQIPNKIVQDAPPRWRMVDPEEANYLAKCTDGIARKHRENQKRQPVSTELLGGAKIVHVLK